MRRRLLVALVALVALGVASGSCSAPRHNSEAQAYLFDVIAARSGGAARLKYYRTIDELLPSVAFADPSGTEIPVVDLAVIGSIAKVTNGRAFVDTERGSREVDWASADADWRTLHLEVTVQEVLGSDQSPAVLNVGVSFGAKAHASELADGFRSLDRVVLFLQSGTAVFDYAPDTYAVLEDGSLLGVPDDNGTLDFPALDDATEKAFLGEIGSLEELRAASRRELRVIQLSDAEGILTRS